MALAGIVYVLESLVQFSVLLAGDSSAAQWVRCGMLLVRGTEESLFTLNLWEQGLLCRGFQGAAMCWRQLRGAVEPPVFVVPLQELCPHPLEQLKSKIFSQSHFK